jgi:hypothetical protein
MTHVEIEITAELVRDLVRDQHPDLVDRPVRLGARGWTTNCGGSVTTWPSGFPGRPGDLDDR